VLRQSTRWTTIAARDKFKVFGLFGFVFEYPPEARSEDHATAAELFELPIPRASDKIYLPGLPMIEDAIIRANFLSRSVCK
jgi:hypothetical protein